MLTVTENAAEAIRRITTGPEVPESAGVRISAQGTDVESLSLAMTEGPAQGDQVVEASEATVYLESGAASLLDDKVLDARVSDQGEVQFLVAPQ